MPTLPVAALALLLAVGPVFQDPGMATRDDFRGRLVTMVFPDYPEDLRLQDAKGPVVVETVFTSGGDVAKARAVSGDRRLYKLAEGAVARWKLAPSPDGADSAPIEDSIIIYFQKEGQINIGIRSRGVYVGWPGTELTLEDGRIVATTSGAADRREPPVKVLNRETPQFPKMARDARVYGVVVVEVVVAKDGCVKEARSLSGHPLLRTAAEGAALQWQFEPVVLDGTPTDMIGTISFYFRPN